MVDLTGADCPAGDGDGKISTAENRLARESKGKGNGKRGFV